MMNLLKKLAACGLSLTMILSLAACGGTDDTSSGESGGEPVKYLIGISQYGQHGSLDNCREDGAAALLSYTALFIPLFTMAGLLCLVMAGLFHRAAEMKAENDLTI